MRTWVTKIRHEELRKMGVLKASFLEPVSHSVSRRGGRFRDRRDRRVLRCKSWIYPVTQTGGVTSATSENNVFGIGGGARRYELSIG